MAETHKKEHPPLSIEEIANTITHGFGLVLSIIGFIVLVVIAWLNGGALHIASAIVFGLSLIVLYTASTLYHGERDPARKHHLNTLDHCCIYLLIAGSYTPFTLVAMKGSTGWMIFGIAWAIALAGISVRLFFGRRFTILRVASYLVLGWLGAFGIGSLFETMQMAGIYLLIAGGIAYSAGVIFFAWERLPHNHAIWHIFVLTGSICHFLSVAMYVLP